MNILLKELKSGKKTFIFWSIGLFVLVFAGMTKYTGVAVDGASVNEIIDKFPRIVQAVLGIVNVNIETLGGYYAILIFYSVVCSSIYGISLAVNAVNSEAVDKTYEFIFTKPRSRRFILLMKLTSGFVYLLFFSILNYLFSLAAVATLKIQENIDNAIILFSISVFLIGFMFFSLAACLCAMSKHWEKGALYGNLSFVVTFVIGIICDMMKNCGLLRLLSPIKYFVPKDILNGNLDFTYVAVIAVASGVLLAFAFNRFDKKNFTAS